jgi:hypothetical protein
MGSCAAQRGFLTLSSCDNPMASLCTSCGRPMCAAHLSMQSGFTQCLECPAQTPASTGEEEQYDTGWSHRYRDTYYRDTGYHAVSSGTYDEHDARAFDGTDEEELGDEGGGGTGAFGDS